METPDPFAPPPPEPTPEPHDSASASSLVPLSRLDRRVVPYWLSTNAMGAVLVLFGLVVAAVFFSGRHPDYAVLIRTLAVAIGSAVFVLTLVQPVLSYVCWRYGLDRALLVARYGILFREEKTIPINRLQHVDLRRGPIERLFGLATLVVFTAGTEGATFRVPGLAVADATSMRDRILAARGDDVV